MSRYKTRAYKGRAPRINLLLYSFIRVFLGFVLFCFLYILLINQVRRLDYYSLETEMLFIFIIMLASDIMAMVLARYVDKFIMKKMGYITLRRHRISITGMINYVIYVFIRAFFLISKLLFMITNILMESLGFAYMTAFFLAWILISLCAKIGAWTLTQILL